MLHQLFARYFLRCEKNDNCPTCVYMSKKFDSNVADILVAYGKRIEAAQAVLDNKLNSPDGEKFFGHPEITNYNKMLLEEYKKSLDIYYHDIEVLGYSTRPTDNYVDSDSSLVLDEVEPVKEPTQVYEEKDFDLFE